MDRGLEIGNKGVFLVVGAIVGLRVVRIVVDPVALGAVNPDIGAEIIGGIEIIG